MVGYRHALHPVGNSLVNEFSDRRLPVENRIICVNVQMYEIFHFCFFYFPVFRGGGERTSWSGRGKS